MADWRKEGREGKRKEGMEGEKEVEGRRGDGGIWTGGKLRTGHPGFWAIWESLSTVARDDLPDVSPFETSVCLSLRDRTPGTDVWRFLWPVKAEAPSSTERPSGTSSWFI